MIDQICGKALIIEDNLISCLVNGIAFEVFVPSSVSFSQGDDLILWIHMHWSADQGPTLFGFEQKIQRMVFRLIIGCSGVGPKLGLAILAQLGTDLFVTAVMQGDQKLLSQVSGIGARKAEQIIVHLKHKVNELLDKNILDSGQNNVQWLSVSQALEALGYSKAEVQRALSNVKKESSFDQKFDILLKKALLVLAK